MGDGGQRWWSKEHRAGDERHRRLSDVRLQLLLPLWLAQRVELAAFAQLLLLPACTVSQRSQELSHTRQNVVVELSKFKLQVGQDFCKSTFPSYIFLTPLYQGKHLAAETDHYIGTACHPQIKYYVLFYKTDTTMKNSTQMYVCSISSFQRMLAESCSDHYEDFKQKKKS